VVDSGNGQEYKTVGSGVIIATDNHHGVIITAKHVVFDPGRGYFPTETRIKVSQEGSDASIDIGVRVQLMKDGVTLWKALPDASDIAAIPLPDLSRYRDIHAIGLQDFGSPNDIYQGAQVLVLGYPVILGEAYLSTPLARGGIIAWTDPTSPFEKRFLIDSNVFNGNSGGPVFHNRMGVTKNGGVVLGGGTTFIGIVVADAAENIPITAGEHPVQVLDRQSGLTNQAMARVLNIGGIGIVEPSSKVRRLIMSVLPSDAPNASGNPPLPAMPDVQAPR
jgi:hypothetical protein